MKTVKINVLDNDVDIQVPDTVAEWEQKWPNTLLDCGTRYVIYHKTLGGVRGDVADDLEKAEQAKKQGDKVIGIVRTLDSEGAVDEKDAAYFFRVVAHYKKKASDFLSFIIAAVAKNAFDPSVSARGPGEPKKIAKAYLDAAKNLITEGAKKNISVAQIAAKLTALVKPEKPFDATEEGIARGISAREAVKRAEAQKQLTAEYGKLTL